MTRSLMNPFASNGLISASRGLRSLAAINVIADAGPGAWSTLYTYTYTGENNAKSSRQAKMRNQISAAIFMATDKSTKVIPTGKGTQRLDKVNNNSAEM